MSETKRAGGNGGVIRPDFPSVKLPLELGNVQFNISTQRNINDYLRKTTTTLQEFIDELSKPEVRPETHAQFLTMDKEKQTISKDAGGFVLGTFRGNRRFKNAVEQLCGVALDADYAQPGVIDIIRYSMPYLTIVHSTRKSTPDKPRYRIIFMLKHPVTPDQHSAISRKLAECIGMEMFDRTTFEPNRMMFFPTVSADSQYYFEVFGRELCNPDDILAEYEDWRDSSKWPMCPEEKKIISDSDPARKPKDPLQKEGVIGAYNRTHSITRVLEEYGEDMYTPSAVPDRWSYKESDSIAGGVVYDHDTSFYSFHASDPLGGMRLNAFDLARLLRFRNLDENARSGTPTSKLPSHKAMLAAARDDGEVKEMLAELRAEKARQTFEAIDRGEAESEEVDKPDKPDEPDEPDEADESAEAAKSSKLADSGASEAALTGSGGASEDGSGGEDDNPADKSADKSSDKPKAGKKGKDGKDGKAKSTAWKRRLEYDNMGELKGSMFNAMLIFHNDENLDPIVYNELSESLEIKKSKDGSDVPWSHPNEIWRDQDDSQLIAYLELNYGSFSERMYKNALAKVADDRRYHPIRDYLNALPAWDGIPRVDRLLVTTLGAADTHYVHAITRKMLVAAIARVMKPGTKFDTIVVMIGPQGTGKSTLVAKLAMKWFNDSLMLSDTKDRTAPEKLQGYWIHEISELAGLKKADQEIMKGFLSRQNDIFRPAYGRRSTPHMRQCIFVGTTNAEQGFLRDTTGNRRFWPVTVPGYSDDLPESVPADAASFHKHSWELTQEDIDQIWAEALTYYKAGESLVLPPELKEDAQKTQRESMETDDREPLVREYLEKLLPENWYNLEIPVRVNYLNGGEFAGQKLTGTMKRQRVCNMEIWTECFGNTSSKIGRADSNQIIAMLERIPGWVRSPKKARVKPYGVVPVYVRDPDYVESTDEAEEYDE